MNALTDQQLLREFAASRSDSAFRELVRRHIDLVHSAARRLVQDSHTAEDVTQAVFTALSKDARKVSSHPVLAGWLHKTTRHLSTKVIRSDARRRVREQQASAMNSQSAPDNESEPLWTDLASHLDDVLGELSGSDRDAVILRYFEKRSAKEIAGILGITAEAAQKRVNRAIERLRESFARRGVTGSAAGITAAIGSKAVQAAPSGLAATIAADVLASSVVTTTTTTMIILQKILAPVAAVALAGTWLHQDKEASRLRAEIAAVPRVQVAGLAATGSGFVEASADPNNAPDSVGIGIGAQSTGSDEAAGESGGFSVAAGAMVDGEWFGAGPGPEPVALDNLGRPTTAMVESLELSDGEVAALETAVRRIREEATGDFVKRVKLTSSGDKEDGYHYAYRAPARSDQGKFFFDAFTKAFTDAIGENRGRKFRAAMDEDKFLGGMGKHDLGFEFVRGRDGNVLAKYWTVIPGFTGEPGGFTGGLDSFEERFGGVFDFGEEGPATYPKVPIRTLPETR